MIFSGFFQSPQEKAPVQLRPEQIRVLSAIYYRVCEGHHIPHGEVRNDGTFERSLITAKERGFIHGELLHYVLDPTQAEFDKKTENLVRDIDAFLLHYNVHVASEKEVMGFREHKKKTVQEKQVSRPSNTVRRLPFSRPPSNSPAIPDDDNNELVINEAGDRIFRKYAQFSTVSSGSGHQPKESAPSLGATKKPDSPQENLF